MTGVVISYDWCSDILVGLVYDWCSDILVGLVYG